MKNIILIVLLSSSTLIAEIKSSWIPFSSKPVVCVTENQKFIYIDNYKVVKTSRPFKQEFVVDMDTKIAHLYGRCSSIK